MVGGDCGNLTAVAIAAAFLVVNYQRALEEAASRADLTPLVTYRYNQPGEWTLIWTLKNDGPGTARDLRVSYVGVNTMCTTLVIDTSSGKVVDPTPLPSPSAEGDPDGVRVGADCEGGMALTGVEAARPSDRPLLFVRPISDEGMMLDFGVDSGVAREINAGEMVWLELTFASSPAFDSEMIAHVDAVERENGVAETDLVALQDRFVSPTVGGVNISVAETEFDAIRLKGGSEAGMTRRRRSVQEFETGLNARRPPRMRPLPQEPSAWEELRALA
jgi:hypothetical protein